MAVVALIVGLSLVVSLVLARCPWLVAHADFLAYIGSVALLVPTASDLLLSYQVERQRQRIKVVKFVRAQDKQRLEDYVGKLDTLRQRFDSGKATWYVVGLSLLSLGFGIRAF